MDPPITPPPCKHQRGSEITPGTRAVVCFLIRNKEQIIRAITTELNLSSSTVGNIVKKSTRISDSTVGYRTSITALLPRDGRLFCLSSEQINQLIRAATASYENRKKTWIIIAKELGIQVSNTILIRAFESRGYKRYIRRSKPWLTAD
jgi:predicted DNA-binding ArsR family transcriptional regulator